MSRTNPPNDAPSNVMLGGGEYDRHARPQASVVSLGLPLVRRAAEAVPLPAGGTPLVFADYGSATGGNSLAPVREAIRVVRSRVDGHLPITVVHNDRPANDFGALFTWLDGPESYLSGARDVFAFASGRSFYERIFPAGHVDIGWSANAVHWLSAAPTVPADRLGYRRGDAAADAAFAERAALDWRAFVEHRALELSPEGWLVVLLAGTDERGDSGGDHYLDLATDVMADMVHAGEVRASERRRMFVPIYFRSSDEIEAPFHDEARARSLVLEHHEQTTLQDPLGQALDETGDVAAFASAYTRWLRGFSEPSLFGALDADRSQLDRNRLAEAFYQEIERRAAIDPAAVRCRWRIHSLLGRKLPSGR